jgi:hypothetical protein
MATGRVRVFRARDIPYFVASTKESNSSDTRSPLRASNQ